VTAPDDREALALLSVTIASIMEDEVEQAIVALPPDHAACIMRFASLRSAGRDIDIVGAAAEVIIRRGAALR
jgi:hypothetical protein